MDLSRNCAAPLTAYYAQKENCYGNETHSRIWTRSGTRCSDILSEMVHPPRSKLPDDTPSYSRLAMFIETPGKDFRNGTSNSETSCQIRREGQQNFWNTCGVLFVHTDDTGKITSISVKHDMFPGVKMVAFPKRNDEEVTE